MSARDRRRAFAFGSFARNGLIGARVGVAFGGAPGVAGADTMGVDDGDGGADEGLAGGGGGGGGGT